MIGLFKNPGAKRAKTATPVNDHDFRKDAVAVAVSYGIYDSQANRGRIVVGTSHDTSQFAGDALALWWKREGRKAAPADRPQDIHLNHLLSLIQERGNEASWSRRHTSCSGTRPPVGSRAGAVVR